MRRFLIGLLVSISGLAGGRPVASAALVTNPGIAITRQVTVQPIVLSNDDGSNVSTYMGSASNTAAIQSNVDIIWSQAGIDVHWLAPHSFQNTIANFGTFPTNQERPPGDVQAIVTAGQLAGVASADPKTLNMYFVRIAPGQMMLSVNSVAGRSQLDEAGATMFVGSNLPGFTFMGDPIGNDLIAKTIAHEIGHNLNLPHVGISENLMLAADGFQPVNARLNAAQIATAQASRFAVAVPEPSTWAALLIGLWALRSKVAPRLRSRRI